MVGGEEVGPRIVSFHPGSVRFGSVLERNGSD